MANLPSYMDMDIDSDIIRGRSTSSSKTNSREASVILNASTTPYHERMEINKTSWMKMYGTQLTVLNCPTTIMLR